MMVQYLNREDIDTVRWDQLISKSANGLVYAKSSLLDLLSPGWKALVHGDYETVMPLTRRRKFGVSYLYQPPFLQQLGVFGKVSEQVLQVFVECGRKHYSFAEINSQVALPGVVQSARSNYIIDLRKEYPVLSLDYSALHQKNLKRAKDSEFLYGASSDHAACIDLSFSLYHHKTPHVGKSSFDALISFTRKHPSSVFTREVRKENLLLASALCLKDDNRIYFTINNVPPEGRKALANHWLVDQLIREFAGTGMVLDFEGSDIPGIAAFYKGFGAVDNPYYFCRWNRLPWPLNIFKR